MPGLSGTMAAHGEVWAEPVPLEPGRIETDRPGAVTFWGGLWLIDRRPGFGGFSALDVSDDGARLLAVSDRGAVLTATLRYDPDGRLTGLTDTVLALLLDIDGRPAGPVVRRDAEAIARLPDGSLVIAFERNHRLLRYRGDPSETVPTELALHRAMRLLPGSLGIEALTALPDGRLLAIAETRTAIGAETHPAWLRGPRGWVRLAYRAAPGHRPTGAATLPGGDLAVLERGEPVLFGIAARLVRIPAAAIAEGTVVEGIELARLGPTLPAENFEAIGAWRDQDGRTRLLILSDDGFSSFQRTRLLQFLID